MSLVTTLVSLGVPGTSAYAAANLTITPITWNTIGLDSNNVNVGPNHFPIGVRVCNSGDVLATNVTATFVWDSTPVPNYINTRPGTSTTLSLASLSNVAPNNCSDFYFEVEVTRNSSAYDTTRQYHITVTAGGGISTSTPTPRELFVEHLVSQSRNAVTNVELNGVSIPVGGTMSLTVGNTYTIKLTGYTATQGYNQLESFVNFPNTIFQVLSVASTYTAPPNSTGDKLYADACGWDNSPTSPTYRSCILSDNKSGGNVTVTYQVKILSAPSAPLVNPEPLSTLIYDFSGSSYHYNSDFSISSRYVYILDPTTVNISKAFSPTSTTPGGTSTLTFTLSNSAPVTVSGVNFTDPLPLLSGGQMVVSTPATYSTSGCGTPAFSPTAGSASLSFSNGTIAPSGTCTVSVGVKVPSSPGSGTYQNISNHVFVGSADTGHNATANLTLGSASSGSGLCGLTLATWIVDPSQDPTQSVTPPPLYWTKAPDVSTAIATSGNGITTAIETNAGNGNPANSWSGNTGLNQNTANPDTSPYFQFQVDTSKYSGAGITLDFARTSDWNATNNRIVIYSSTTGVAGSFTEIGRTQMSTAWPVSPATSGTYNASATGSNTYFRVTGIQANNDSAKIYLDNIKVTGCGTPQPPTVDKAFSPDAVLVNGTSTLTFTLTNLNTGALHGLQFTDTLPAGLTVTNSGPTTICDGSLTTTAPNTISFSGGALSGGPGSSCSITTTVTATTSGPHTNISNFISSTESGTNSGPGGSASASLNVLLPPQISKYFDLDTIIPNGISTLTFVLTNPNPSDALPNIAFTDTFPNVGSGAPGDMVVATPATYSASGCGTPSFAPVSGAGSISFSSGTIAAGGTCTVTVNVTAPVVGDYPNTSGAVTTTISGVTSGSSTASSTLTVKAPNPSISLIKQISNHPTGPWGYYLSVPTSGNVYYRFVVENTGDVPFSPISLTDNTLDVSSCNTAWASITLPVASPTQDPTVTCVVGPVSAAVGNHVNTARAAGTYSSTPYNSNTSSATYVGVNSPLVTKSFSPSAILPGGTSTLTISIQNPVANTVDLTGVAFTDNLPTGMEVALTPNANPTNCGTPAFSPSAGNTTLTFSGGTIAVGGTCTVTVDVTMAASGTFSNTVTVSAANSNASNPATGKLAVFDGQPTKSIVATSESSTGNVAGTERVTIGEMVRYRIAEQLPEGSFANVQFLDNIPTGLQFLNDGTVKAAFVCNSGANCLTSTTLSDPSLLISGNSNSVSPLYSLPAGAISGGTGSGVAVTFNLGDLTNSDSDADQEYVVIEFNALVLNLNQAAEINQGVDNQTGANVGNTLNNSVSFSVNGSTVGSASANVTVSVAEPAITSVTKSVSPATGPYNLGESITYTLTFTNHSGNANDTTAFDVVLTDTLDSNLTVGTVTPTSTQGAACAGGTSFSNISSTTGQTVTVNVSCLDPGQSVMVTIAATIKSSTISGTNISNASSLAYSSLPGAKGNCATMPFSCSAVGGNSSSTGERNGSEGAGPDATVLNNYYAASNTVSITATGSPAISLVKGGTLDDTIVSPSGITNAGDKINYTFTVDNTGNVILNTIILTDGKCDSMPAYQAGDTNTDNNLDVTETWAYACQHTLTQLDIDGGSIVNNASVASKLPDTSAGPTASDSHTVTISQAASLVLSKNAALDDTVVAPGGVANAGDMITYGFSVENTGNATLTNIQVTDPLLPALSCTIATLVPGSTVSCVAGNNVYALTQTDINTGRVDNTATADSDQTSPTTASRIVTISNNLPDAVNDGPVTLAVNSPNNVLNVLGNDSFGLDGPSNSAITIMVNPSHSTASVNDSGTPNDPTDDTISYTPTAGYSGTDNLTYQICDGNGDCDPAVVTMNINDVPAPVDDNAYGTPGVVQTIDVTTNDSFGFDGPNTGTITIITGPAQGTALVNDNGTPNDPTDDQIDYTPNSSATGTDQINYQICDSNGDCDTAVVTITLENPGLDVTKTVVNAQFVNPSVITLTYSISLHNTGDTGLNAIQVADDLTAAFPSPATFTLAGGGISSANFTVNPSFDGNTDKNLLKGNPNPNTLASGATGVITLVVQVTTGGGNTNYTNIAAASGTTPGGKTVNASGSASGPSFIDPALTKTIDPTQAAVGDTVTFTITVTNHGTVQATGVVVTDPLPDNLDYVSATSIDKNTSLSRGTITLIPTRTVSVNIGTVDITDEIVISIVTRVNGLGQPPIQNRASLTADLPPKGVLSDPVQDNTATVAFSIAGTSSENERERAVTRLPSTGFAPNVTTVLPPQPADKAYADTGDIWLEIPRLNVWIPIVGVPRSGNTWDVTWLSNQAGWLEGTAFPTWKGNSVLTGHVYLANGKPGPFVDLNKLRWGDEVIAHAFGQAYHYAVRTNQILLPKDMSAFKHEDKAWLTLITCKGYDEGTDTYNYRLVTRAVLLSVKDE